MLWPQGGLLQCVKTVGSFTHLSFFKKNSEAGHKYHLVAADLRDVAAVENGLTASGIDFG